MMVSETWDVTTDVLVVGSGAGGQTAAIAAADQGAQVVVIEKSRHYGGTSAMSGGAIWIPVSSQAREAGAQDSPEEAFQYIRALAAP
ncbi:MAG: fumarate reductase/succinate dehydrogenase flavoprotein, partial [Nevskia sp.]|nr:fumarate reductase/succinate dehydrogenase flavoprotein [Nevskia sp.]